MSAAPHWLTQQRAQARRGPGGGRLPLLVGTTAQIGSVALQLMDQIGRSRLLDGRYQLSFQEYDDTQAWALPADDASGALNALAAALRRDGCCGPWRDEQLAVRDLQGRPIATVERGAVRVLGIATDAVHLIGLTADGAGLWVQQRSLTKASHPGEWDTLMGGMVSAHDTLAQALARETQEEAGLRIDALADLRPGPAVRFDQPSDEGGPGRGYMRECINWWSARLPGGTVPVNQDGEVARFEPWSHARVLEQLAAGAFTPEATLVLGAYYEQCAAFGQDFQNSSSNTTPSSLRRITPTL
ncbi:MAG: NUDIX domain-containing protein [Comamonas sp.]